MQEFTAYAPLIEAGRVFLPSNKIWLKDFTDECEEFPNGEYDDVVDTVSQFLMNQKGTATADIKSIKHKPRNGTAVQDTENILWG